MKTEYYSSLPSNDKARANIPSSPKKTIQSASSTILQSVNSATSSAKKMKNRARSFGKLLSVQSCTPVKVKQQTYNDNDMCDLLEAEDEITPMIYFPDQDAIARRMANRSTTFIDPFAFSDDSSSDKNEFESPTSVIPMRLFPEESCANTSNDTPEAAPTVASRSSNKLDEVFEPVVTFDCPVFTLEPQDVSNNQDDDTSLQLSEAIKSINIKDSIASKSVREKFREMRDSRRDGSIASMETWQESFLSFTRGSGWNKYKWEPKSDGA